MPWPPEPSSPETDYKLPVGALPPPADPTWMPVARGQKVDIHATPPADWLQGPTIFFYTSMPRICAHVYVHIFMYLCMHTYIMCVSPYAHTYIICVHGSIHTHVCACPEGGLRTNPFIGVYSLLIFSCNSVFSLTGHTGPIKAINRSPWDQDICPRTFRELPR